MRLPPQHTIENTSVETSDADSAPEDISCFPGLVDDIESLISIIDIPLPSSSSVSMEDGLTCLISDWCNDRTISDAIPRPSSTTTTPTLTTSTMSTNKPGAAPSPGSFRVIDFTPDSHDPRIPPIYKIVLFYAVDPRLAEDVLVSESTWLYKTSDDKSPGTSGSWEPLFESETPRPHPQYLQPRQDQEQVQYSTASLDFHRLLDHHYDRDIALNLTWVFRPGSPEEQQGWSRSGNFLVQRDGEQSYHVPEEATQVEPLPDALQQIIDAFNPTSTVAGNLSPTTEPTPSKGPIAPPNRTDLADAPANESGGAGLSTGAIVGIAVGAGIAGLLLIAALVWFFCRRRRSHRTKNSGPASPYGSDAAQAQHAANKESTVNMTETPQSPYSENGTFPPQQFQSHSQSRQSNHTREGTPLVDHVGAPSVAGGPPNVAVPFSDADPPTQSQPHSEPRPGARSVTPNVAHLIEEGMTEEEIRRLEEEERALDDAIQAAQSRRAS